MAGAPERALAATALARREGYSLRRASSLTRTTPATVRRHAASAWVKAGAHWRPTLFDRIPRAMTVLTPTGPESVVVRDSRTASAIGEHANAVSAYLETGDERDLRALKRRAVRIRGQPVELVTDPVRIDRLAAGGELHYELYRH